MPFKQPLGERDAANRVAPTFIRVSGEVVAHFKIEMKLKFFIGMLKNIRKKQRHVKKYYLKNDVQKDYLILLLRLYAYIENATNKIFLITV